LKKKKYILLHPDEIPPEEHSISKWKHFLPPIVNYYIGKSIQNTSTDFDQEFVHLLNKGHKAKHNYINTYKSKHILHTYSIVESINDIVRDKGLLL